MSDLRVVVTGAAGRMGLMLVRAIHHMPGCKLVAALERPGSVALGEDAGLLAGVGRATIKVSDDPAAALAHADALIDFTTPETSVALSALTAAAGMVHVIGTTGLSEADFARL